MFKDTSYACNEAQNRLLLYILFNIYINTLSYKNLSQTEGQFFDKLCHSDHSSKRVLKDNLLTKLLGKTPKGCPFLLRAYIVFLNCCFLTFALCSWSRWCIWYVQSLKINGFLYSTFVNVFVLSVPKIKCITESGEVIVSQSRAIFKKERYSCSQYTILSHARGVGSP